LALLADFFPFALAPSLGFVDGFLGWDKSGGLKPGCDVFALGKKPSFPGWFFFDCMLSFLGDELYLLAGKAPERTFPFPSSRTCSLCLVFHDVFVIASRHQGTPPLSLGVHLFSTCDALLTNTVLPPQLFFPPFSRILGLVFFGAQQAFFSDELPCVASFFYLTFHQHVAPF